MAVITNQYSLTKIKFCEKPVKKTVWLYALGHCTFGRPTHFEMLCYYFHIIFNFPNTICFMKCISPSCSNNTSQHDATTFIFHSLDGLLGSPLLPSNVVMVIMAKHYNITFVRPQDIYPEISFLVSVCICKLCCVPFLNNGFILSE